MYFLLISFFVAFLNPDTVVENPRLLQRVEELRIIAQRDSFNIDFAILVDMSISSEKYRYFVVNLHDNSIVLQGLCAHGGGRKDYGEQVVFSNVSGSLLSSEGKYLIGSAFMGDFGLSYKLYGIEATNSNALTRGIVLHAWKNIPDLENGKPCSLSNGCPMLSENVFRQTAQLIDQSELPILMWIYK